MNRGPQRIPYRSGQRERNKRTSSLEKKEIRGRRGEGSAQAALQGQKGSHGGLHCRGDQKPPSDGGWSPAKEGRSSVFFFNEKGGSPDRTEEKPTKKKKRKEGKKGNHAEEAGATTVDNRASGRRRKRSFHFEANNRRGGGQALSYNKEGEWEKTIQTPATK